MLENVGQERNKKLSTCLIGAQAIALARYSLRIVDVLEMNNESVWGLGGWQGHNVLNLYGMLGH